jgi:hypothetical protein
MKMLDWQTPISKADRRLIDVAKITIDAAGVTVDLVSSRRFIPAEEGGPRYEHLVVCGDTSWRVFFPNPHGFKVCHGYVFDLDAWEAAIPGERPPAYIVEGGAWLKQDFRAFGPDDGEPAIHFVIDTAEDHIEVLAAEAEFVKMI